MRMAPCDIGDLSLG
jgi:hypothetical protein